MSMSGSEILKAVTIPFRIYNVKRLSTEKFVFSLSFKAFKNCNITTAKKILSLALDKELVIKENNSIIAQFDPWATEISLNWEPEFKGLEKVQEAKLSPLPDVPPLEIKPVKYEEQVETISEPFQLTDKEPDKKVEKSEKPKEVKVKKKESKKIDQKQQTLIKKEKETKKSKKLKKKKKKTKTLMDFMK